MKFFTGNHPSVRSQFKRGRRPVEFGNKVWATSLALIDYLQAHPRDLDGLKVLEIGCGWGLVGVYLAKEYGCQVTCTDFDENVLPIVQLHADLNQVKVVTRQLSFAEHSSNFLKEFDLIVGVEVCYSSEATNEIITLIENSLSSEKKQFLIADPGRPDFDDCQAYCKKNLNCQMLNLPGTVNGRTTYLLKAALN